MKRIKDLHRVIFFYRDDRKRKYSPKNEIGHKNMLDADLLTFYNKNIVKKNAYFSVYTEISANSS